MIAADSIFHKICNKYNLGELVDVPAQLTGGLMHRMYSLFTEKGKYAVKMLNPYVMQRESAMSNYRTAETLERILEKRNIPILAALSFDGQKMLEIDGQYFYLFDWFDGTALRDGEITEYHCREIGKALAGIHQIDCGQQDIPESSLREEIHIDWDFYLRRMQDENRELYELLRQTESIIYESQEQGNAVIKKLPQILAICHNDMDSKNVLWKGQDYRIIDLECLSYANPALEMYELALCWSGYYSCQIDFHLFREFIGAYLAAGGVKTQDWAVLYDSNNGRLEWLEYNVKRVLGIECGADEKEMGISQVRNTLAQIKYYYEIKETMIASLSDF